MKRRTYLALASVISAPIAGCLGTIGNGLPGTDDDDPLVRSGPGEHPHDITVHNSLDRAVTLTITVDRDGTQIYREEHTVAADSSTVVAGITRVSLPEDDRRLSLTATTTDGQSTRVEVLVSDCLGSVDFYVDPTGELGSTYSIC